MTFKENAVSFISIMHDRITNPIHSLRERSASKDKNPAFARNSIALAKSKLSDGTITSIVTGSHSIPYSASAAAPVIP